MFLEHCYGPFSRPTPRAAADPGPPRGRPRRGGSQKRGYVIPPLFDTVSRSFFEGISIALFLEHCYGPFSRPTPRAAVFPLQMGCAFGVGILQRTGVRCSIPTPNGMLIWSGNTATNWSSLQYSHSKWDVHLEWEYCNELAGFFKWLLSGRNFWGL